MISEDLVSWARPALTPTVLAAILGSISGTVWAIGRAFHTLLCKKAEKSDVEALKGEASEVRRRLEESDSAIEAKISGLESEVRRGSYDLGKALASVAAVHQRLDDQIEMLRVNTVATQNIAERIGAATAAFDLAKFLGGGNKP